MSAAIVSGEFVGYDTTVGCCGGAGFAVLAVTCGADGLRVFAALVLPEPAVEVAVLAVVVVVVVGVVVGTVVVVVVVVVGAIVVGCANDATTVVVSSSK